MEDDEYFVEVEPVYTHTIVPANSIDISEHESPLVSLDGTQWIIRRLEDGEQLTLQEVVAIKLTPEWGYIDEE